LAAALRYVLATEEPAFLRVLAVVLVLTLLVLAALGTFFSTCMRRSMTGLVASDGAMLAVFVGIPLFSGLSGGDNGPWLLIGTHPFAAAAMVIEEPDDRDTGYALQGAFACSFFSYAVGAHAAWAIAAEHFLVGRSRD
jgi:hypothetical protein